jgi:hypothetical protein
VFGNATTKINTIVEIKTSEGTSKNTTQFETGLGKFHWQQSTIWTSYTYINVSVQNLNTHIYKIKNIIISLSQQTGNSRFDLLWPTFK